MLGSKLGEGQHASVYKCFKRVVPTETTETTPLTIDKCEKNECFPEAYAVKIMRSDDPEKLAAHRKEYEILRALKHENVVEVKELFEDSFKSQVFQVMSFVEGKEVLDEIADMRGYSEADARRLVR